ncbi:MAG TPA: tRNA lysidine(34) synthetase TilS [Flavobacterium sp.]
METALQKHLSKELPYLKEAQLLLAASGGMDSMVLLDALKKFGYTISIAHCNFQLRGAESFADQKFVEKYALEHNIPIYTTIFDTEGFAADYKLSTQVAARELRYNWFYELTEEHGFDFILTAHHADDNLETFLINLSRGTGIGGLTGIPHHNDKIVRPLMPFTRSEIELYAKENGVEWREDSSNASEKYLRNKIRHELVPVLKELNPEFLTTFQKTQDYLRQTQSMADDAAIMVYQQVAQSANDEIHYNLKQLKKLPNYRSYLYHWLREFGFTAWNDVYDLCENSSGKQVFAPQYKLLKNRGFLILSPLPENSPDFEYFITEQQHEVDFPVKLSLTKADALSDASNKIIFADADKLRFPLQLRKWREGDVFFPLGMGGKSKKISKLFKDEKLSLNEKERVWLLCSDNKIVWVTGIRADERFKVEPTTTNILQIALH